MKLTAAEGVLSNSSSTGDLIGLVLTEIEVYKVHMLEIIDFSLFLDLGKASIIASNIESHIKIAHTAHT